MNTPEVDDMILMDAMKLRKEHDENLSTESKDTKE